MTKDIAILDEFIGNRWIGMLAMAAFLSAAAASPLPLMAQGLETEGAIDTIVDADVATDEKTVADEEQRIAAALDKSGENAAEIRKRFSLNQVEIVFVRDLTEDKSPLETKIEEQKEAIGELRVAIEGSAMLYHAIDSHSVLLRDVVAVEFDDDDNVTIFAAGVKPQQ